MIGVTVQGFMVPGKLPLASHTTHRCQSQTPAQGMHPMTVIHDSLAANSIAYDANAVGITVNERDDDEGLDFSAPEPLNIEVTSQNGKRILPVTAQGCQTYCRVSTY
jgi:hypothetical protein